MAQHLSSGSRRSTWQKNGRALCGGNSRPTCTHCETMNRLSQTRLQLHVQDARKCYDLCRSHSVQPKTVSCEALTWERRQRPWVSEDLAQSRCSPRSAGHAGLQTLISSLKPTHWLWQEGSLSCAALAHRHRGSKSVGLLE